LRWKSQLCDIVCEQHANVDGRSKGQYMEIQSVIGPISGDNLGFVLAHEHVVASSPGILQSWPALFGGRENLVNRGVNALTAAKAAGVNTIVDCTTFDLGRDAELLAEVSRRSGMIILACTGIWLDPSTTIRARTPQQLSDFFIGELNDGIDGTSIRAAVIKVAHNERVEEFGEVILRAAAAACVATNAPIITHTAAAYRTGEPQSAILEACGVDPSRVAIGHSDDSNELDYLAGLAGRGYYIAMDRLPNGALSEYGGQSVDDRVKMIVSLIDSGFADRILVGHDDPIWAGLLTDVDQQRHIEANPRMLSFVSQVVLPALSSYGVTDDLLRLITVENPRRWICR
jgi:phosphotriesterase-related protein